MDFKEKIEYATNTHQSLLCIGIDPSIKRIKELPGLDKDNPLFDFGRRIVEECFDQACAFKLNIAFFEEAGYLGLKQLSDLISLIKQEKLPVILDCKRGDIGSSSKAYANAAFKVYDADAVTLSPYMGSDSIKPFSDFTDRFSFVLCLTSNLGAQDFQIRFSWYRQVIEGIKDWMHEWERDNLGLVLGATKTDYIREVREAFDGYLLVPGVGEQGGNLKDILKYGRNKSGYGLCINVSRSIIFASMDKDFPKNARRKAIEYRKMMLD